MTKKAKLLEMLITGQAEMLRFANALTEAERQLSGTLELWAPKDVLAHLCEWRRRLVDRLMTAQSGETPPIETDYEAANASIFAAYSPRSLEDILSLLEESNRQLLALVEGLSEDDLHQSERFPWLRGRPLWCNIAGSSFIHPMSHLGPAYIQRGDLVYATQLREKEAEMVAALDDAPAWQGIAFYNLACHYALSGETSKAMEKLEPALQLNPDLIEWSQQDDDLTSLHGEAAFRALVARLK